MTRTPLVSTAFGCLAGLPLLLELACGARTAGDLEQKTRARTQQTVEGGVTPLQASLALRSPEAAAIQDVPFQKDPESWLRLQEAVQRYRAHWTFVLTIGPKPDVRMDPARPLALDIENNGGQWGDHERNLRRLMFEMGDFIQLVLPNGTELRPSIVEFQRSFGIGKDRQFLMSFPCEQKGKPIRPPFKIRVREFGQGMGRLEFPVASAPETVDGARLKTMWEKSVF